MIIEADYAVQDLVFITGEYISRSGDIIPNHVVGISLIPLSPSIMAGDTVTLTCSVTLSSGVTGTLVFQWEGPGVTPTPAYSTTSGMMVSSDLTLSEISTSQAGVYTCTATLGGSFSISTNITVQSMTTKMYRHLLWEISLFYH